MRRWIFRQLISEILESINNFWIKIVLQQFTLHRSRSAKIAIEHYTVSHKNLSWAIRQQYHIFSGDSRKLHHNMTVTAPRKVCKIFDIKKWNKTWFSDILANLNISFFVNWYSISFMPLVDNLAFWSKNDDGKKNE